MFNLSKVFWMWNYGSVTTELYYSNNSEKKFYLSKPPPTAPAHDISHFICGFHNDMEWDFSVQPNHISEYNAVFMEHLLLQFEYCKTADENTFSLVMGDVFEYMRWFADDYYKISENLDKKYTPEYLKMNFLKTIDSEITSKLYRDFYSVSYLTDVLKLPQDKINMQLTMDINTSTIDQDCYEFIERVKKIKS